MEDQEEDIISKISEDKWYEIARILSIKERKHLALSTKKFYFFFKRHPKLNTGTDWCCRPVTVKFQVPYSVNVNVLRTSSQLVTHQNNYSGATVGLVSLKDGGVLLSKSCLPSYKFFVFNDEMFLLFQFESLHVFSGSTLEVTQSVKIILPNGKKISDAKNHFCCNSRYLFIASYDGIYYLDILNLPKKEIIELRKLQHDDIPDIDIIFNFVNIFDEYLIIEGRLDHSNTCQLLIHLDDKKVSKVDNNFPYFEQLNIPKKSISNNFTQAKNGTIYFVYRHALYELVRGCVRIIVPDLPFKYNFSHGSDRSTYSLHVLSESHILCFHQKYCSGNQLYDEMSSTSTEAFILDYINNKIVYKINWLTPTTKILSCLDNAIVFENRDPIEYQSNIVIEQFPTRELKFSANVAYDDSNGGSSLEL